MANLTNTSDSEWSISNDIYDITSSLNDLKKRYVEDEDETTLALGVFGYVTDTEAKKIQSSIIMTGELGNEMFPTRAKLTKNVLTHALYCNIEDINATPAHMTLNFGIKVDDFDKYCDENHKFTIDAESAIFIDTYEFHFDYDIIVSRSESAPNTFVYSAHYDMTNENRLSKVVDPYLKQPFVLRIGNYYYIIFQATVRQYSIEDTLDTLITDSVIANKTYTFDFENQIADFDVYITENNKTVRLRPLPYGTSTEGVDLYCWYLFISDKSIRVTFDSKSYTPGINAKIQIRAYTTLGKGGIFNYTKIDESSDGFFIEMNSTRFNYDRINTYAVAVSDSTDGTDRKTKEELQKLIPKAALSRGSITTETDVSNYFNIIDTEDNRLKMQKKEDNQISRVWYGYFLLKDEENNIIPSNTVSIEVSKIDKSMKYCADGRYILPAGSIIEYDAETKLSHIIDEAEVPELFSDDYFYNGKYYYMTIYNMIVNPNPLYTAYYMTSSNKDSFFNFNWVNEVSDLQFVATRCNFKRKLLTEQNNYIFTFKIAQSINADYGMYIEENVSYTNPEGEVVDDVIVTNNMKCIIVLYNGNVPYRWTEAELIDFERNGYKSSWKVEFKTDNELDDINRIKLKDLHVAGSSKDINYGFFDSNVRAKLYILAKFEDSEYGKYDLEDIVPELFEGYSVTNVYEVDGGLDLYEDFTNVLETRIRVNENDKSKYIISGLPAVGLHYMTSEEHSDYLIDAIMDRKAYIDYCLILLENSMNIDFKLFNTYGPSEIYTIGDKEKTLLKNVDLSMKFRVSLKSSADAYTKDEIIAFIKDYIEDLYGADDWHAPAMINALMTEFASRVYYIEFMNYNNLRLGLQHILLQESESPYTVPEFINIRNRYNSEGELEPCIDIEIVT